MQGQIQSCCGQWLYSSSKWSSILSTSVTLHGSCIDTLQVNYQSHNSFIVHILTHKSQGLHKMLVYVLNIWEDWNIEKRHANKEQFMLLNIARFQNEFGVISVTHLLKPLSGRERELAVKPREILIASYPLPSQNFTEFSLAHALPNKTASYTG